MESQSQRQRHTQHQRVMAKEAPQFIHGCLCVTIFEATNLQPAFHALALALEVLKMGGVDLNSKEEEEQMKLKLEEGKIYCMIEIENMEVAKTEEIKFESQKLIWNNSFNIHCAHPASTEITLSIRSENLQFPVIGLASIPISKILTDDPFQGWFDLVDMKSGKIDKAQVHICFQFSDARSDPLWNSGIPRDFSGVKAYYNQKTGCNVTLYQDSHLSNDFNPEIRLSNNRLYQPPRLWEDVYNAIHEAKHFIYVAGWSIYVNITLIRDPDRMIPEARNLKIGELLKKKADEGLTVLVMIWKETIPWFKPNGFVGTHCNETWEYFKNTNVKCFLCERDVSFFRWLWLSHHQKTVILDAPLPEKGDSSRQIISFVGGVDLCDGRFDNEKHPLFRTMDTIYRDDFYQKNFPGADLQHGGPREPWHDAHSKLEGLAAWDILDNFEKRWQKQAPGGIVHSLLNIRGDPQTFPQPSSSETKESWNVQVFRSIDDGAVIGFPSDPSKAVGMGLIYRGRVIIDQSIHNAYIQAIRRAKRFIYIENQYFFGSCEQWTEDQKCGCSNLVPFEIALKIEDKIKKGERFAAYILTPMWPEGEPESRVVQAMLYFNRRTMEMMYSIIAQAIKEKGLGGKAHPCDYLNFFCLANRETKQGGEYVPPKSPKPNTNYWNAQNHRRFLIYVHSKLMIVDDEYVIVGSANINQRSLDGGRDTEIAHGSYQPQHTNEVEGKARGILYGYRMSLWYEHFMSHWEGPTTIFEQPEAIECVQKVKQIADDLWKKYVANEVIDLPGHLLPFPVEVAVDGSLSDLSENGLFPDTEAAVEGRKKPFYIPKDLATR